jgi:hypothetical protein
MEVSPPIQSGSNGPIAKECHRFLVAGPFKFVRQSSVFSRQPKINTQGRLHLTTHSLTFRTTDSGASTSISTNPSL